MPRISYEDQKNVVRQRVSAEPNARMTHNDLVAALENDGYAHVVPGIPRMVRTGDLVSQVIANPGKKADLWYSLPDAPSAPIGGES